MARKRANNVRLDRQTSNYPRTQRQNYQRLDQSTYQNEDRDPKINSKRLMIQIKEIYKFKKKGDGKSHKGSTRGINELNFPSVVKGDLIGCLEI